MARKPRVAPGGWIYHVLNRSVGRMKMFRTDKDFVAFERTIAQALEKHPIRLLSYCIMSNHWHFAAWPKEDGDLTGFFRWLTHTHAMRWRVSHRTVGYGHLYQGRFKSFPIQKDEHLLTVGRYVGRNALSAGLVQRAQDWQWNSLWVRSRGNDEQRAMLSEWPVDRPRNWIECVNARWTAKELSRLHESRNRNRPYGDDSWTMQAAHRLGLTHTLRREGRPRKESNAE